MPVTAADDTMVRAELQDRSFRQFEPHVDGDPRRGVIVSFFGPLSLWAQYAEGRYALNEWEITSREYRIEKHGDTSEVTLYFVDPRSSQGLPTKCDNCIDTAGVSISIRNYEDRGSADIKINDPDNVLPSPFPVFRFLDGVSRRRDRGRRVGRLAAVAGHAANAGALARPALL